MTPTPTTLETSFDKFWNLYNYKKGREKTERKWNTMAIKDRQKIMETLPQYIKDTPDRQYRKHPYTYLNSFIWNDEAQTEDKVLLSKPKEQKISQEPSKYFDPKDGKRFIIDKIKLAYEGKCNLKDYGGVYTKRLHVHLRTPVDVMMDIELKVKELMGRKPKNRFEEKVEYNYHLEVNNRILKYNMDRWREQGIKIYEQI